MRSSRIFFCCAALTIAGCDLEEETKGWAPIAIVAADPDTEDALAGEEREPPWECWVDQGEQVCCDADGCCVHDRAENSWSCE